MKRGMKAILVNTRTCGSPKHYLNIMKQQDKPQSSTDFGPDNMSVIIDYLSEQSFAYQFLIQT
jgi:hypothetical protein